MRSRPLISWCFFVCLGAGLAGAASFKHLSLENYFNAGFNESILQAGLTNNGNDLSAFPTNQQTFSNITFAVKGIVQLTGPELQKAGKKFPEKVEGIPINRSIRKLHLLHGVGWATYEGALIGAVRLNYADGSSMELGLKYGEHVRDWWGARGGDKVSHTNSYVAWKGKNAAVMAHNGSVRIYLTTFENPFKEKLVKTVDFITKKSESAPFILGITTEGDGDHQP